MIKYLSQKSNVTKTYYNVILVKFWPKNAQILKSDFETPQNRKIPVALATSDF